MSNIPDKYLITIRYGGYHHIRPTREFTSTQEAVDYRNFIQAQLTAEYNKRKGRSKGAKPFVYVWAQVDLE